MGFLSALLGLHENGPCCDCEHGYNMGGRCRLFSTTSYSRVSGESITHGDCESLRASGGKCAPSGKYWEEADKRSYSERSASKPWDGSFPGDSGRDM